MKQHELTPDGLLTDWRSDTRTWLWVDLATWPAEILPDPYPPVPVIAVGQGRPPASAFDLHVDTSAECAMLSRAIEAMPFTAAAVTRLLRTTERMEPGQALLVESLAFAALQAGAEHRAWLAGRTAPPEHEAGTLHLAAGQGELDIVIDRPAARNAIDRAMRDALFDAFTIAALDDRIAITRLRAVGRCFSVGADLAEFGTTRDPVRAADIRARTLPAWPLLRRHGSFEVHVQGACIGSGLELAAFADRLTAMSDAWFQLPELAMGILPGFGGCVSIPRRIGRQRTAWMIVSGRRITARTALRWGLIDAIVDEPPADDGGPD